MVSDVKRKQYNNCMSPFVIKELPSLMYRPPVYFEPKIRVREESNKILVFG